MEFEKVSKSKIALIAEFTNLEKTKKEMETFLSLIEKKL